MAKIVVLEDKGNHVLPVTVTDAVRANDDSANLTELLDSLRSDIGAIAKLVGEDADGNVFVRRKEDGTARALYSFGAISTKGDSNDSSGGGGGADLSAVWQSLTTNIDSFADLKINANHIPTLTSAKIGDFASAVAALVPTNISQLVNDAGYITASAIANKADKATTLAGYGITDALRKATENYSYDLNANKDLTQLYAYFQRMVVNGVDESPTGTSMRLGAIAIAGGGSASNLLFDHYRGGIWYRNYKNSWSNWRKVAWEDEVHKIGADISAPNIHASAFFTANSVNLAECIVCNNADGIINLFGDKIVANSPIEAKQTIKIGNATLYYDPATDSIVCDKNLVALGAISTKG